MAKKLKGLQMLVANRLDDGRAVFFNEKAGWLADARQATVAEGEALTALTDRAHEDVAANFIAGFEPVEALLDGTQVRPSHGKPLMQMNGPSVRRDLGYQAGPTGETA